MKSVGEKNSILVMTIVLFEVVTASGEVSGIWLEVMKRVLVAGWKTPASWKYGALGSEMRRERVGDGPRRLRKESW